MTNTELTAALKMLKIDQYVTTPNNYRFLLSVNPIKIIYINRKYNTYVITNSHIAYEASNEIDITHLTLPFLLENIND